MMKEFLSRKIEGIDSSLDSSYELEKHYEKMYREDNVYCYLMNEFLHEEGVSVYNELSDIDFKKPTEIV